MIREADILHWAETYRDMARQQALDPRLRSEFTERAKRYEIVARAVKHDEPENAAALLACTRPPS
jgi:hypothetical protein